MSTSFNWRDEEPSIESEKPINWPEPTPLPAELTPVEPFHVDLLPKAFQAWVADVAERMQCAADFPAAAIMVVVAGILGRKLGIRPKKYDDWTVVPNLWGAVIGRPGTLKTPALSECLSILRRLDGDSKQDFDKLMAEHSTAAEIAEVTRKSLKADILRAVKGGNDVQPIASKLDDLDSPVPTRRRYLVNDSTPEKLGSILAENPNGVTLFRDELVGWLKQCDKPGQETARAFFLECWPGDSTFTVDRVVRGTIDIASLCLSLFGGSQPGAIGGYLRSATEGGVGDDGMLQRLQMLVWPDSTGDWENIDRHPDADAKRRVVAVCERLDEVEAVALGTEIDEFATIPYLRFDAEAQVAFDAWRTTLEQHLRSGQDAPCVESHLSKYRSLVPTLALLCHLVDDPDGGSVPLSALNRAIAWAKYLETHARRLYGSVTHRPTCAAKALAKRIQSGDVADGFTVRDVYRKCWSGLSDRGDVQSAVDVLADCHWLASEDVDTGGRPQTVYRISPHVIKAR